MEWGVAGSGGDTELLRIGVTLARRPGCGMGHVPHRRRPAQAPTTAWAPALHDLVADSATDLLTTIPNAPGDAVLREVSLVGDHNACHVGEFAILRQVMGTWPPGSETVLLAARTGATPDRSSV